MGYKSLTFYVYNESYNVVIEAIIAVLIFEIYAILAVKFMNFKYKFLLQRQIFKNVRSSWFFNENSCFFH